LSLLRVVVRIKKTGCIRPRIPSAGRGASASRVRLPRLRRSSGDPVTPKSCAPTRARFSRPRWPAPCTPPLRLARMAPEPG